MKQVTAEELNEILDKASEALDQLFQISESLRDQVEDAEYDLREGVETGHITAEDEFPKDWGVDGVAGNIKELEKHLLNLASAYEVELVGSANSQQLELFPKEVHYVPGTVQETCAEFSEEEKGAVFRVAPFGATTVQAVNWDTLSGLEVKGLVKIHNGYYSLTSAGRSLQRSIALEDVQRCGLENVAPRTRKIAEGL